MLRNLIDAGEFVAELGYDEGSDIDETLDKAEKRVYEVTSSPTLSKFTSLRETLTDAWARLERFDRARRYAGGDR